MDVKQILVIVTAVLLVLVGLFRFIREMKDGKVTEKDVEDFRKWLVYAVTIAQMEFGKDTAEVKLYKVWDMALDKFPWIAAVISFETFTAWVDTAKEELLELEENNEAIAELINGFIEPEEIEYLDSDEE